MLKIILPVTLIATLAGCQKKQENKPQICSTPGVNISKCSLEVSERSNWSQSKSYPIKTANGEVTPETKGSVTVIYAFDKVKSGANWKRALTLKKRKEDKAESIIEGGTVDLITADTIILTLTTSSCSAKTLSEKVTIKYKRNGNILGLNPKAKGRGGVLGQLFGSVFQGIIDGIAGSGSGSWSPARYLNNPSGNFKPAKWPADFGQLGCFSYSGNSLNPFKATRASLESLTEGKVLRPIHQALAKLEKNFKTINTEINSASNSFDKLYLAKKQIWYSTMALSKMKAQVDRYPFDRSLYGLSEENPDNNIFEDIRSAGASNVFATESLGSPQQDFTLKSVAVELAKAIEESDEAFDTFLFPWKLKAKAKQRIERFAEATYIADQHIYDSFQEAFGSLFSDQYLANLSSSRNLRIAQNKEPSYDRIATLSGEQISLMLEILIASEPTKAQSLKGKVRPLTLLEEHDLESITELEILKSELWYALATVYLKNQRLQPIKP